MGLGYDLKLLVFDFDGTLFDLGVNWHGVRRLLGIDGTAESLGTALQRLSTKRDPRLTAVREYELAALGDRRVSPEVAGLLEILAARYRIAILTRNSREVVERAWDGMSTRLRLHIVGREDTTRLKPDPAGLYQILRYFGITPDQTVLIGDTYHDVEAAKRAGLISIVVSNKRLSYQPAGADHYVDCIADLLSLLAPGRIP